MYKKSYAESAADREEFKKTMQGSYDDTDIKAAIQEATRERHPYADFESCLNLMEIFPGNVDVLQFYESLLLKYASIELKEGDAGIALKLCEKGLSKSPNNADLLKLRNEILRQKNNR